MRMIIVIVNVETVLVMAIQSGSAVAVEMGQCQPGTTSVTVVVIPTVVLVRWSLPKNFQCTTIYGIPNGRRFL